MKAWHVFVASAVVGLTLGASLAWYRVNHPRWDGTAYGLNTTTTLSGPPTGGYPSILLDSAVHDFGSIEGNTKGRHDFLVKNTGTGSLKLEKGETTCQCTKFEIERTEVPPGESTKVIVEYNVKNFRGTYRQSASMRTNDPKQGVVQFTIQGKVINAVKVDPPDLAFHSVTAGEARQLNASILVYVPEELKLSDFQLTNSAIAQYFDVKLEAIPKDKLEAMAKAKTEATASDAKAPAPKPKGKPEADDKPFSGYQLQVNLKPGLPLGAFRQTLHWKANLRNMTELEIPLQGTISSDLTVIGADWLSDLSLLNIGTIQSIRGEERTLYVIVRGPHRKSVNLKPMSVTPDGVLQVEVKKPMVLEESEMVRFPVVIRIPKGQPMLNCLGGDAGPVGEILLETGHPTAPKLLIRVRFAIQDRE
jgi:hypothetical protein